jgi:large subunit ribosomal protein L10
MSTKVIENKKKKVEALKEKMALAKLLILSDFRRFTVKEITTLRKKLRAENSEYKVAKNTLLVKAAEAAGFPELKKHLQGTTAVLFGYGDPVTSVKTLVNFLKEIEKGEVRAGVVENAVIETEQIQALAKLPSKEILIAKVVGGLKSPLYGLVNVLVGPMRKLVYALNAVKEKKEKEG